jgi:hypothetical protein
LRRKDDLCILISDEHLSADEYDVRLLSVLRRHVFWRGEADRLSFQFSFMSFQTHRQNSWLVGFWF